MHSTGLLPRSTSTRREYALSRPFLGAPVEKVSVYQKVPFVRDQRSKPSCVGQALAACIDGVLGLRQRVPASAVDIWVDARRRQGDLEGALEGTRAEYAIESLLKRGWSNYEPGEDSRPVLEDMKMPSLAKELFADDHRQSPYVKHFSIASDRVNAVLQALQQNFGVVMGTGTRAKFFDPPSDTVLRLDYLSGDSGGHEQRIFCYDEKRRAFGVQGSYGSSFGGFRGSNGVWYPGCVLVDEDVIEAAWDIDVLEIVK